MKRAYSFGYCAFIFGALLITAPAQTVYFWTGLGTGWQGQVTPPNDGTAILYLSNYAINQTVPLPVDFSLDAIILDTGSSGDTYEIQSAIPSTLLINTGIVSTGTGYGRLEFGSNINIANNGPLVFDAGTSSIVIPGQIIGSTALGLISSNTNPNIPFGAFIFNNTGAGNTYSGGTTLGGVTGSTVAVAFWNSSPFGTGALDIFSSAQLIAHNTLTVTNPITFSTFTANDPIYFRSWDAPLTLSGPITLGSNTTLSALASGHGVPAADNSGIWPTPGSASRNPIVFTGTITESGSHSLTVNGAGVVILNPSAAVINDYTGGTFVNGSLVFGNDYAIPGGVGNILVNNSGYVGFGDTSVPNNFAVQIGHISLASTGALGVDTLPGNPTITYSDPIDLSRFTTSPSIRIGTATSAILTGTITPQGANYQFGNGGGTLYVQSSLPNVSTVSNLQLIDTISGGFFSPLKVFLQGNPNYTGDTIANNGFIIFDGNFLPGPGKLVVAGGSTNPGASYIGFTNRVDTSTSSFLGKFDQTNTWGIVGFDTHPGDPTATFGGLDLTGFNNGVYLGTATSAIFSGPITPTADNILRLTAGNGGTLTVNSNITGGTALALGSPSATYAYSDGKVILNGANTYTGGTTINSLGSGLTLEVGNAGALGTGPLTLPQDVSAGLQASTFVSLPNPIVFQTPAVDHGPASLYITGGVYFELAGAISGPGSLNLGDSQNFVSLSLSGNNLSFTGDINLIGSSSLVLNNNNAAGMGTVRFNHTNSTLSIGNLVTNPVLYGIDGDANGFIQVNSDTVLTFDTSNSNNSHEFGGFIGNEGSVSAALVITASVGGNALYLSGSNGYTGGTTITNYGAVGLGNNNALGTGMVTLNASHGAVALNDGITLTNPLTFTAGALMGFGTFQPSNLTSITIDTNKAVIPGLFTIGDQDVPGKLTLATDVVFANGGKYFWSLQDVARSDGYSLLNISGNLNITATTGGFTLDVLTIDMTNHLGFANLSIGTPYTFTILQTTGTITGFNASAFTVDGSLFQNGTLSPTVFTLTSDPNHLFLSFTPVPEPSTWALLATGASVLGLAMLRRRRA